jgi:hypothetical protein
MALPLAANNGGAVLAANGNFCAISVFQPTVTQQGTGDFSSPLLKDITYTIVNGTATGTLTFQELGGDGTWRAMATPAPVTLSAITINGTIAGAYHGIRVALTALAVSTVTYVEIRGTVVNF